MILQFDDIPSFSEIPIVMRSIICAIEESSQIDWDKFSKDLQNLEQFFLVH